MAHKRLSSRLKQTSKGTPQRHQEPDSAVDISTGTRDSQIQDRAAKTSDSHSCHVPLNFGLCDIIQQELVATDDHASQAKKQQAEGSSIQSTSTCPSTRRPAKKRKVQDMTDCQGGRNSSASSTTAATPTSTTPAVSSIMSGLSPSDQPDSSSTAKVAAGLSSFDMGVSQLKLLPAILQKAKLASHPGIYVDSSGDQEEAVFRFLLQQREFQAKAQHLEQMRRLQAAMFLYEQEAAASTHHNPLPYIESLLAAESPTMREAAAAAVTTSGSRTVDVTATQILQAIASEAAALNMTNAATTPTSSNAKLAPFLLTAKPSSVVSSKEEVHKTVTSTSESTAPMLLRRSLVPHTTKSDTGYTPKVAKPSTEAVAEHKPEAPDKPPPRPKQPKASTSDSHRSQSEASVTSASDVGSDEDGDMKNGHRFRPYQYEQWTEKFQELCDFRKEKGHCQVPHTYSENPPLARWVKRQRYQYKLKMEGKQSTMTGERIILLGKIGFIWDSHAAAWAEKLHELKEYTESHGDCNVPSTFPENPQLATWVKCQRRQFKLLRDKKTSNMTTERIAELEELGFIWEVRKNGESASFHQSMYHKKH